MAIVQPIESGSGARRRLELCSPATLEPIGEIEVQTAADVEQALERARKAQPAWGALPVEERARVLERALKRVIERQDEIVETVIAETGKAHSEALSMEVFASCDVLSYYAKRAAKFLRPEKRRLHGMLRFLKKLQVVYRPLGVVGVITPWNGPFILSLNPTAQALVAGNAVLLKPSEITPRSGALAAEILNDAGLPEGVLQVLTGDGETGAALCEAGVDKICFTGSVATGRKVATACAQQLIPCTLELGGKDPMIVCADADLDSAAGGALAGAYMNTGQYCCGTERVYVVDEVADAFTDKVVERAAALRQGASGEFDVGAIFWDRQMDVIERHMEDAIERGATVRVGGRRNPELAGLYYEPTVLTDVDHDMLIMKEETFGPILPIMRVRDEEEALQLANDTRYGLSATVWSQDTYKAQELAKRLESGGVCINDMTMTYGCPEAPFGGLKESGVGQVNGESGLKSYCHALPILTDRFGGKQARSFYPYSSKKDAGLKRVISLVFDSPLRRFLG
jgi:succinate-semialdehyde dehydrogenase/glutarate-semialdehyde dehydrogenase